MRTIVPIAVLGLLVLGAVVGPQLTMDPNRQDLRAARAGLFTPGHPLGTDAFGRDLLARVLEGGRISLAVGLTSVGLCIVVGGGLGMIAGYRRRGADAVIMRFMDMVLAFPTLVLALSIAAFLGPSIRNVIFAVAFSQLPHYARLGRAVTLSISERDFVVGARLLGASDMHILRRHVIPNIVSPLVTYGLLAIAIAIMVEASLSFLGLGVQPPTPSWGAMISEARPDLQRTPHIAFVPGAMLFLTILSLNIVAERVRPAAAAAAGGS